MKLLIAILLAVFLSGCSLTEAILPTVTQPETVQPPTEETTAPKEEYISTYLPGSSAEMTTDGAIKVYVPDVADALRLYPMGDHLLLLSGGSTSSLTVLEKETMAVCAKLDLDCLIPLETGGIWVSDSGVAYINEPQRSVSSSGYAGKCAALTESGSGVLLRGQRCARCGSANRSNKTDQGT